MSIRLQRVVRWVLTTAFVVSVALLVLSWVWRGYEPPLQITGQPISPLAFSPQGDELAVGSMASGGSIIFKPVSPIRFLSTLDGTEIRPPLSTHATAHPSIVRAEYSPDGKMLAVLQPANSDKMELVVFDVTTRTRLAEQTVFYANWAVTPDQVTFGFAPDSSFFYLSGPVARDGNFFSRSVVVWDLVAGKARFSLDKTGNPAVSPDSQTLVTIDDLPWNDYSKNAVLQVRNIQTGEPERSVELSDHQRGWPAFSPDGKLLVVGYNGLLTEVFDTSNYECVFKRDTYGPKFLADGTLISVAGREVQIWNTTNWQLQQTHTFDLGRHWDNGDQLSPVPAVVPNRSRLVVFNYYPSRHPPWLRWLTRSCRVNACGSNQMTLIDVSEASRRPIELHKDQITSGAMFSPDGERIAIGYLGGDIEVYKLPPQASYVAPCVAASLVLVLLAALLALGNRIRPATAGTTSNAVDGSVPARLE